MGKKPETFGNPLINELFDYWESTVGYKIKSTDLSGKVFKYTKQSPLINVLLIIPFRLKYN